jgi:lipid II:glycine glycyltransferase (peptidoglycan interpeptide bridge formation enzyme)
VKSLLQTSEWASFRKDLGWQAHDIEDISVLEKKLPLGKSFLYAPEVEYGAVENFEDFLKNIKKIAKENKTIFFRLEILDKNDVEVVEKLKKNGFIKAFEEVQPEWRQIVNISGVEEEILAGMKQKGRYNIRVAQKHNVVVEKSEKIEDFYQIFLETSKRDGFEIRPLKYFQKLMEFFSSDGVAELWVARYNNKTVAAIIATFYDGVASYLYGASSDEYRNVMAPYLLHWQVMKRAKEKGCKFYDLLAVAPEGVESHKYIGITRFKEQFGGEKVQIIGSYDLVYKPVWYKMFKFAEKVRRK